MVSGRSNQRGMKFALVAFSLVLLQLVGAHRFSALSTKNLASPDVCQTCLVGVRVLEDFLCDPSAVDFLVEFAEKRVCPALGDTPRCHNLAEGLLPTMVQWFRAAATPASLCSAVGVCGSTTLTGTPLAKPSLRVKDDTGCVLCKYVVDRVKQAVDDSSILERVKEKALEACSALPEELGDACAEFVNEYEPMIAELVEDTDAEEACELLGVCVQALVRKVQPPVLSPEFVKAMSGLQRLATVPAVVPANDACDYCKMAVLEAHTLVSDPSVQQSLINYTKSICDNFPSAAAECKVYVDQYSVLVFTLLEQYLVPDTLCVQLGMCPAKSQAITLLGQVHESMVMYLGLKPNPFKREVKRMLR